MHHGISPGGVLMGLVATGGYELQSTEFDNSQEYAPNDLLTAPEANTIFATGGVLTNRVNGSPVKQYVDPVCGVVAAGKFQNHNKVWVLDFWTYFLPGAA